MRVITRYPVIFRNKVINRRSEYSNITAASTKESVSAFQQWYNKQRPAEPLVVDGVWGPKTSMAWETKGRAYESQMGQSPSPFAPAPFAMGQGPLLKLPDTLSPVGPGGEKQPGKVFDKVNGVFIDTPKPADAQSQSAGKKASGPAKSAGVGSSKENIVGGRPMGKNAKLLIGAGAFIVLVLVVYGVTRKSK